MSDEAEKKKRILIVEDSEAKYRDVLGVVQDVVESDCAIFHAENVEQADDFIELKGWHLVLLDISLNIRESKSGPRAGGHDTTGGLRFLERMYLLNYDAPVVVVTAFDAFPPSNDTRGTVLGIVEVLTEARRLIGPFLVGHVAYGSTNWQQELKQLISKTVNV